jgi:hypothetical protein
MHRILPTELMRFQGLPMFWLLNGLTLAIYAFALTLGVLLAFRVL